MDGQKPDAAFDETLDDMDDEEIEVTREELVAAMQGVLRELSEGLKGGERQEYVSADDLVQNDWFFAGVSDEEGQFAVTMWPAEGEDDMLRIDIGSEEEVHKLAENPELVEALTDDFIAAMSEEEYDEYDDDDEDVDEEDEDDDELEDEEEELDDEEDDEEYEEDDVDEDESNIGRNGNTPL